MALWGIAIIDTYNIRMYIPWRSILSMLYHMALILVKFLQAYIHTHGW